MRVRGPAKPPEPSAVLTRATLRAASSLDVSDAELAKIIGISTASVSRLRSSARTIDPGTKEGEFALTFLRLYRRLAALLADPAKCRGWFHARNNHLGAVPAEFVRRAEGLVDATRYLESMRP